MCGDLQFAFAADLHADQALVPAFDDAAGADNALEGFVFAVGGIEFGAVFEPAGVVGGDEGAFDDGFAVAKLQVFNDEFVHKLGDGAGELMIQMQIIQKRALQGLYMGDYRFFAGP